MEGGTLLVRVLVGPVRSSYAFRRRKRFGHRLPNLDLPRPHRYKYSVVMQIGLYSAIATFSGQLLRDSSLINRRYIGKHTGS